MNREQATHLGVARGLDQGWRWEERETKTVVRQNTKEHVFLRFSSGALSIEGKIVNWNCRVHSSIWRWNIIINYYHEMQLRITAMTNNEKLQA